jgi:integrase
MTVVFKSILKDEISMFMDVVKLSVVDYKAYQRTLTDFDLFVHEEQLAEKQLVASQIERWLDGFDVHLSTKKSKLSHLRRFSVYLSTLGIAATLPELPRSTTDFTPYVFTADEMALIFDMADDLVITKAKSRVTAEFPMLLRILYGCGLRLGEALSLTWNEVDLADGIITVKIAKNQKQRLVPMSDELTRILRLYRKAQCFEMSDNSLLFKKSDGFPRSSGAYWTYAN